MKLTRVPSAAQLSSLAPLSRVLLVAVALLAACSQIVDACGPIKGGGRRRLARRPQPPLVQRQCIPNVSEHTLGASGRHEGSIRRTDKRFKELVQNWNPDIEFKDDERTGADRMMTQRLKEKLSTLAISVMNQWPNVKLRVIEGWDEDGMHQLNSLHYEGRAVDITTSDKDRSKYGMLARLAVEAGFDWVHYESRTHVHCSVKSERSNAIRNNGCFDADSVVQTPDGPTEMSNLGLDQYVLTMDSKSGQLKYSPVIMWLDVDAEGKDLFVELKTKSNRTIRLTSSHLIYVADDHLYLKTANSATNSKHDTSSASKDSSVNAPSIATAINANSISNSALFNWLLPQEVSRKSTSTTTNNFNVPTTGTPAAAAAANSTADGSLASTTSTTNDSYSTERKQAAISIDDFAYTTYARNLYAGQYLLINSALEGDSFDLQQLSNDRQSDEIRLVTLSDNNPLNPRYELDTDDSQAYRFERGAAVSSARGADLLLPTLQTIPPPYSNSRLRFPDNVQERRNVNRQAVHQQQQDEKSRLINKHITLDQIVSVNFTVRKGKYAPLTREGNIVVNSVVASCYAVINDHGLAHLSFAPVRWARAIDEAFRGRQYSRPSLQRYSQPERAEVHWYPLLLYTIGRLVLPARYLY